MRASRASTCAPRSTGCARSATPSSSPIITRRPKSRTSPISSATASISRRKAQATDAEVIAFCGVRFMAETAKILSPDKIVVLPDMNAGCSLEDSCPPDQFKAFREAHPDHIALDLHQQLGRGEGAQRHHRHLLVGRDDPQADPARAEDHLRPRQASRRLSRAARPGATCCSGRASASSTRPFPRPSC